MKTKILIFRDRFDILMEIRLSGVAMRLIWEMSATIDVRIRTGQPLHFQDDNLRAGHSADVDEIA